MHLAAPVVQLLDGARDPPPVCRLGGPGIDATSLVRPPIPLPMSAVSLLRSSRGRPLAPYTDVHESARQEVILTWPVDECHRLRKAHRPGLHLGER
jgi:hypothetical protein